MRRWNLCMAKAPLHQSGRLGLLWLLLWSLSQNACAQPGGRSGGSLIADDPLWQAYAALFITPGGRVIDTGNGGVSHSEGQGWGLLLAVAQGDRERFDLIWRWTQENLQIRSDALSAWRYDPAQEPPVHDRNNASDGDLMIAWAMWRAWERWREPHYRDISQRVRADIASHLVREHGGYTVLLPGRDGFEHDDRLHLNLSYLVMPALREFHRVDAGGPWQALYRDAQQLLDESRTGVLQLPPDWLALAADGSVAPAPDQPPRFGFEAVRIPLFFMWGEAHHGCQALCDIQRFWEEPAPPAWVDVRNGRQAEYSLSPGGLAVRALLRQEHQLPAEARDLATQDYYSASLAMLTRLAMRERDTRRPVLLCQ